MHPLFPLSALIAEIESYPFASFSAHQLGVVRLAMQASGVLYADSERLAGELVESLLVRSGGMSLASLRLLISYAWFAEPASGSCEPSAVAGPRTIRLAKFAGQVASRYLELAGDRAQLHSSTRRPELAESFRWLTINLPQDFLVAALAAKEGLAEPPLEFVRLVSPQLASVLEQGCAETHLHLGAAVPFSQMWSGVLRALSVQPDLDLSQLQFISAPGSRSLLSNRGPGQIEPLLLAAAIARIIMAAFLMRMSAPGWTRTLRDFLHDCGRGTLSSICRQFPWSHSYRSPSASQSCMDVIRHVCSGDAPLRQLPIWHSLHRLLRGAFTCQSLRHDPLEEWLIPQVGIADTETRFTHRCLSYLLSQSGHLDALFERLFFQYVRIRCALYQSLVQAPGAPGLDYFVRYFNRIWPVRAPLKGQLFGLALQTESRDLHLASLEIRRSPSNHWYEVRDEIRAIAKGRLQHRSHSKVPKPEIGLVLHFVKQHETKIAGRRFLYADPRSLTAPARHGLWFQDRWAEAAAICHNLRIHPEHLLLLRGIDVANTELAQPTWVLIPLWQRVFATAKATSALLAQRHPRWAVPCLRTTIHVGEDFVRLPQGLRRMHEPIEYGLLRVGDRIGHGLALGIDPSHWESQLPQAPETLDERLDDLVWEFERYQKEELPVEASRLEYVRAEVIRLATAQYAGTDGFSIDDLIVARRLRHHAGLLAQLRYPYLTTHRGVRLPAGKPYELLWRYLTDPLVFERGQQTLLIQSNDGEQRFLLAAQRWLRTIIGKLEITIESNPSSNLLIGGFHSLESLPTLRMSPLEQSVAPMEPRLLVSLNTDNPITFASCLADEITHVFYGLLRRSVPAPVALAWIDRARRHGMQSRFTLAASRSEEALRIVSDTGRLPSVHR